MISKVTTITEPLTNHLLSMKDEFYLEYQDMNLVEKQIYHYFCNSYENYIQYNQPLLDPFGITINTKKDEALLKLYEIGLMASTFYLIYHDIKEDSYEYKRCMELEELTLIDVFEKFYQDTSFAMDLIDCFLQSDLYSIEELNQRKEQLSSSKNKIMSGLYPFYTVDKSIHSYQKNKKREI